METLVSVKKTGMFIHSSTWNDADLSRSRIICLLYPLRAKSDPAGPNILWDAYRSTEPENSFDLHTPTLVLDRHSITILSVASLHLREAILVNGLRRRSGQRTFSNRTRCITCSQRRNLQRLLFVVYGQRQACIRR